MIDHMIIPAIIGAEAKGPVKTLYQGTSSFSISFIILSRIMIYLKTILDKSNNEVVAMKENPIKIIGICYCSQILTKLTLCNIKKWLKMAMDSHTKRTSKQVFRMHFQKRC